MGADPTAVPGRGMDACTAERSTVPQKIRAEGTLEVAERRTLLPLDNPGSARQP